MEPPSGGWLKNKRPKRYAWIRDSPKGKSYATHNPNLRGPPKVPATSSHNRLGEAVIHTKEKLRSAHGFHMVSLLIGDLDLQQANPKAWLQRIP